MIVGWHRFARLRRKAAKLAAMSEAHIHLEARVASNFFVPILYREPAFEAFDDFSDFLESISCEVSKGFIPEPVFTFIPESCSGSSRNSVRNHPGIAFILPRIPHLVAQRFLQPLLVAKFSADVLHFLCTGQWPRRDPHARREYSLDCPVSPATRADRQVRGRCVLLPCAELSRRLCPRSGRGYSLG